MSTLLAPPRNCGGPMPEFRRGWGRWLPRAAERDLFHPSLEDLRAEGRRGIRLQIAIAALWLDCWRVWATDSHRLATDSHRSDADSHRLDTERGSGSRRP